MSISLSASSRTAAPNQTNPAAGRMVLARRGARQPQGPANYRGTALPVAGQNPAAAPAAAPPANYRQPLPGAQQPASGPPQRAPMPAPAASNQARPGFRPFSADAQQWSRMQAQKRRPASGLVPTGVPGRPPAGGRPGDVYAGTPDAVRAAAAGMFGGAGSSISRIFSDAGVAGAPPAGQRPGDVSTGTPDVVSGTFNAGGVRQYMPATSGVAGAPPAGQGAGDVYAGTPDVVSGAAPQLATAPTKQLAGATTASVLGGEQAPMNVYDPNEGKQEAQPIGMQTSMLSDAAADAFTAFSPFGSRTPDTPVEDDGQQTDAQQEQGQQDYLGPRRGNSRVDEAMHNAYEDERFIPGTDANDTPPPPNNDGGPPPPSTYSEEAYNLGKEGMTLPAELAGGAASALNDVSKEDINQYFDDFKEYDPMMDAGKELMSEDYWKQTEDANRRLLQGSVESERNAQLRQALGMAGRGGQLGAGTLQGIYGSADKALSEGELRQMADAAQRRLSGTTAGAGIMGNALAQKYGLLQEGYTSPRETFAALAEMFPELVDALNPAPDFG